MATFFLIVIYITFISLGLPDSLLGSAWPIIQVDLAVPLSGAGLISMIITGGTIVSSLLSNKLINIFGTGKVTCISVAMTALALLGFSAAPSYIWLCLLAIPLGLGAGAIDSALNNFVALHYKASHMSWLHCFWGVGATVGPIIMSIFLTNGSSWKSGYKSIAIIQFSIVALLIITLPMWRKVEKSNNHKTSYSEETQEKINPLKLPGSKFVLLAFFCYCSTEMTTGLWASSYLVNYKGISPDIAARWVSLFYAGITLGRLISGFATAKFENYMLIRIGQIICILGASIFILPLPSTFSMIGLILIGLGCAPIYPSMLHDTPNRFGEAASQSIMGFQMACAYIGSTLAPPLLGILASRFNIIIFPFFLLILIITMLICSEKTNLFLKERR